MAGPWFTVQKIGEWTRLKERVLVSNGARSAYATVEMKMDWAE
jgi:hypothetical protein